jgi:hypothetical protein
VIALVVVMVVATVGLLQLMVVLIHLKNLDLEFVL